MAMMGQTPEGRWLEQGPHYEDVVLGRNQFDLLTHALEGLLNLLVEDWHDDAPIAKNPWWDGPETARRGTGEIWDAIHQARGVLGASQRWASAHIGSPIDQPDDAHNRQTWSTIEPSHDTSR